ncbi:MAG TPA: MarR family transcriptional regulator [Ktedonobacteraceae bacterium]|nr:MarR family transcriptional regulator [Ktedonobacteraceae bacterium]
MDTYDVAEIASILDAWYARLGRQFGPLSRPQRRVLRQLRDGASLRVGEMADQLGLTTAGTTRMLDKLEEMGYITRARSSSSDQRQVYVSLSPAGEQALLASDAIFLERVQLSLSGLTVTERVILEQLLRKLNETAP